MLIQGVDVDSGNSLRRFYTRTKTGMKRVVSELMVVRHYGPCDGGSILYTDLPSFESETCVLMH